MSRFISRSQGAQQTGAVGLWENPASQNTRVTMDSIYALSSPNVRSSMTLAAEIHGHNGFLSIPSVHSFEGTALQVASILLFALLISISVIIPACSQEDDEAVLLEYGFEEGDIFNYSMELEYQSAISELTRNADYDYELDMKYSMKVPVKKDDSFVANFSIQDVNTRWNGKKQKRKDGNLKFCFPTRYCTKTIRVYFDYDDFKNLDIEDFIKFSKYKQQGVFQIFTFDNRGDLLRAIWQPSSAEFDDAEIYKFLNDEFIEAELESSDDFETGSRLSISGPLQEAIEFVEKQIRIQDETFFVRMMNILMPIMPDKWVEQGESWEQETDFFAEGFWIKDETMQKWQNYYYFLNKHFKPSKNIVYTFDGFEEYNGVSCAVIKIYYKDNFSGLASNAINKFKHAVLYKAKMYFDYDYGIPIAISFNITLKSNINHDEETMYSFSNRKNYMRISFDSDMEIQGLIEIEDYDGK